MDTTGLPRVLAPVLTPFNEDLTIDDARFLHHCDQLVEQGAGLALFGTNSEANSLALSERAALLDTVLEHGITPAVLMPGTGTCSIPETVQCTTQAVEAGCPGVLMLPTFYYKNQSTAGVVAYFSEVIERVGDARLRIYLYNIPSLTGVPISVDVLTELSDRYPDTIAGLKDSSGDWSVTEALLAAGEGRDLNIYVGSERFLLQAVRAGAKGCISATANVNAAAIVELANAPDVPDADEKQQAITDARSAVEAAGPLIPAVKAALGARYGDPTWGRVRPPLEALVP